MKLPLALLLALAILGSALILRQNPDVGALTERVEELEGEVAILQDRFEASDRNARMVIEEVQRIVVTGFSHVIPISGGLLAIEREEE